MLQLLEGASGIRMSVTSWGYSAVLPYEMLEIEVCVYNGSDADLEWTRDHPVKISYHWIRPATGEVLVYEGLRTDLGAFLLSGEQRYLKVPVLVPAIEGQAILRLSLLYEGHFWFDERLPASACDFPVTVKQGLAVEGDPNPRGIFSTHETLNIITRHRGGHRPLMLICETTNICNHHCVICAYDHQTRKKQTMPLDLFRETITQYAELGGGVLSLSPMVGDIFLDRLLPNRLSIIAEYRSVIKTLSVTTNAVYAKLYDDAELADVLGHFDNIYISVYGLDAEEFEEMTRTAEYELMRTGVERILRLSKARITIGFRCLKERSSSELHKWVQSIAGFDAVSDRVNISGNLRQYGNWGIFDTLKPLAYGAAWLPIQNGEKVQCGIPLLALQVFSNGNVSHCPGDDFDNHESLHLGNVMETTLREILTGPKAQKLWDWASSGTPEFCKNCSFHRPLGEVVKTHGIFENPLILVGG